MTPASRTERALSGAVHACLALVLLTPLVWAPDTFHPFSVGKAAWSRSAIAVAFALWVPLALAHPRWRPPPSALLAALAIWLAVAALSAALGVSPQRSLWSTYTRMEGLVDAAHWAAFALVLAAMLRTPRARTRFLDAHLCVGLAVALIAILRFHAPGPGPFGLLPEGRYPRISATTANPTFLGAYLQATALVAAGMLAAAFLPEATGQHAARQAAQTASGRKRQRGGRRSRGTAQDAPSPWPVRILRLATLAASLAALALTGSMGALAGLFAGAFVAAALVARHGRSRRARRIARAGLAAPVAAAVLIAAALAIRAVPSGGAPEPAFDSILLERVTSVERIGNTLGGRIDNWRAGMKAFAERPLLGWGTGNYFVGSGRHREPPAKETRIRDHAHNMIVEEAATKGIAGLAAYALLWGLSAAAALRVVRAAPPRDQALAALVAGALAGWFVQGLTLFPSPESWLQHMVLLAVLVRLDAETCGPGRLGAWMQSASGRAAAALPELSVRSARAVRVTLAAGALAIATASIAASVAIHRGDAAILRAEIQGPFLDEMERSMRAFEPLANGPRVILFNNVAANWPVVSAHHPDLVRRLLVWTAREAEAALAAEPESWVIHHALARMHLAMAETHPEHAEATERHVRISRALAPGLDPMEAPVGRPVRPR